MNPIALCIRNHLRRPDLIPTENVERFGRALGCDMKRKTHLTGPEWRRLAVSRVLIALDKLERQAA